MPASEDLLIKLRVNANELKTAQVKIDQFSKRGQHSFNKLNRSANSLLRTSTFLIQAWSTGYAIRGVYRSFKAFGQHVDTINNLRIRIGSATRGTDQFAKSYKGLLKITQETGIALEDNVSVFQQLKRFQNEFGASTDDILELNRALSQVAVISGSNVKEVRDGLRQLAQGLGAGTFRAEEINSVLENLPELAKEIASGMGLTTSELRNQIVEGKILSVDVYEALMKRTGIINENFKGIPKTMQRASVALKTEWQDVTQRLDKAIGFSEDIVELFEKMQKKLKEIDNRTLFNLKNKYEEAKTYMKILVDGAKEFSKYMTPIIKAVALVKGSSIVGKLGVGAVGGAAGLYAGLSKVANPNAKTDAPKKRGIFDKVFNKQKRVKKLTRTQMLGNLIRGGGRGTLNLGQRFLGGPVGLMGGATLGLGSLMSPHTQWNVRADKKPHGRGDFTHPLIFKNTMVDNMVDDTMGRHTNQVPYRPGYEPGSFKEFENMMNQSPVTGDKDIPPEFQVKEEITKLQAEIDEKLAIQEEYRENLRKIDQEILRAKKANVDKESKMYKDLVASKLILEDQKQSKLEAIHTNELQAIGRFSKDAFNLYKVQKLKEVVVAQKAAFAKAIADGDFFRAGAIVAEIATVAGDLQAMEYQGGRARGGAVNSNSMYRVNERGPELLSMGGKDFLMTGSSGGHVTPNKAITPNVNVNIHNPPGHTASVEKRQSDDGFTLDVIIEQVEASMAQGISQGNSKMANAIESQYGVNRSLGAYA